jgi:WD40 repeat protein
MNHELIDYSEAVKGTCFLVKNFMAGNECEELVTHAENIGFDKADDKYPLSYRTNKRCWEDDETLAQSLWYKLSETGIFKQELTDASGINSRLRYCRYDDSEIFNIHRDGRYYKAESEYSKLTFLLYLSDASDYEGGCTRFFSELNQDSLLCEIKGNKGDVLIFDHTLWHEGGRIRSGTKHVLRTDVLFCEAQRPISTGGHLGYVWKIIQANKHLISAGRDAKIKIWDEKQNLIQTISEHESSVLDLAIKDDRFFSASRDSSISSYSRVDDRYGLDKKVITTHGTVLSITACNENRLISGGADGVIRLWKDDLVLLDEVRAHDGWCWQVIYFEENTFFSIGSDGMLKKWSILDNRIILALEFSVSHSGLRAIFITNGDAWVGTEDGEILHINRTNGHITSRKKIHAGIVREIMEHNGLLYTCGEDGCVYCVNPRNYDAMLLTTHSDFATTIAIAGSKIYSGGYDGKIRGGRL